MTAMTLKLAQLRFGHDPLAGPEINARKTGRMTGIDEMASMLSSQGQLERLLVVLNPTGAKESEGLYFVVNGNRRLAAMQKHQQPDAAVLVEVAADPKGALEASLATNTTLPMHPVDRFRAYSEVMKRDRLDAAQLARRFGLPTKEMQKALALGTLANDVLDAWLAGVLSADQAAVFTLQPDKKAQAALLASALKNGGGYRLEPSNLRTAIIGKRKDVGKLVAFVGADAYRKAGGKIDEDLFGAGHVAHDPVLAVRLAREKLKAECAALVKAGWAWAEIADDMPEGWEHRLGYGRLDKPKKLPEFASAGEAERRGELIDADEAAGRGTDWDAQQIARERLEAFDGRMIVRAYPAAKMATAGCVVSVGDDGEIEIEAGVLKPEAKKEVAKTAKAKEKAKAAKSGEPAKPAQIPASLAHTLSQALTRATTTTIIGATSEQVLRIAVAAMAADYNEVVKIECEGMAREHDDVDLIGALKTTAKLDVPALLEKLAFYVGKSIDMQCHDHARDLLDANDETVAVLNSLSAPVLQEQLLKEFDADDYFDRAPGAMALAALAEMKAEDSVPKGAKKAAIAKVAATCARAASWLPPQLRTKDYDGPKAAPAKAKPTKAGKPAKAKTGGKKKKTAKK